MKNILFLVVCGSFFMTSCNDKVAVENPVNEIVPTGQRSLAKFEPRDSGVLVFVGQDLASIGGLPEFQNGYANHFPIPAGVTLYTGLDANDGSFGGDNGQGLSGVYETVDHGNGPSNMQLIMNDPTFSRSALAIGLSLVNHEDKVAQGLLDKSIEQLGTFLLDLEDRPVFLRIGYEFDGYSWNHYDREDWLKAYKRIKVKLDSLGVRNVAYVWQSVGWVSNLEQLEAWYPGDEYVDWCGFSFFDRWRENRMIEFARLKNKPVFIAEASATVSDFTAKFDGRTKEIILSNPAQAQEAWDKWFVPFFETIENNLDVVKAIHYIDCNWKARPMWFDNPTFQKVDARLETSKMISERWLEKMNSPLYLNASDNPF